MELSKEEQEAIELFKEILDERSCLISDDIGENDIKVVLNLISKLQKENEKQSKVIDETTKEIENMTGSCPLDRFDFNDIDCENKCNTGIEAECWKQYFYRKVERR